MSTGRSSINFVAIWLGSVIAAYSLPPEALLQQAMSLSSDVGKLTGTAPASAEPLTTASDIDQQILVDFGAKISSCWTIPAGSRQASLRLRLSPNGELEGDPTPIFGDGAPVSQADERIAASAVRAVKKCSPYTETIAKAPNLAGQEIVLTFDPTLISVSARLVPDSETDDPEPVASAIELVLEIERNAAAAMQARSTARLYRLRATRTSLQDGIVFLEQDVGANNVVYATIYCAFNETAVDANQIPVGGTRTYSAVLYNVSVAQRQASSGFSSGVINFKQILLTSCQIAD